MPRLFSIFLACCLGLLSACGGGEPAQPEPVELQVAIPVVPERDFNLCGTLTLPSEDAANAPGVVLVSGTDALDRQGTASFVPTLDRTLDLKDGTLDGRLAFSSPALPFKSLARKLALAGFAVLRYDNRAWISTHGSSCGLPPGTGPFTTYALDGLDDARHAVDFLKARPEVRGDRIFVVGYGAGGHYALRQTEGVRGIVLIGAGSAAFDAQRLAWLAARVDYLRAQSGAGLEEAESELTLARDAFPRIRAGRWPIADLLFGWGRFYWESWIAATEQAEALTRSLAVPCLFVQGAADPSLTPADLQRFQAWAPAATSAILSLPGTTGALTSGAGPEVSAQALDGISAWLSSVP